MSPPSDKLGAGAPRENPYVGLVPFGPDDVAWFFGREREREIIGANLRSSRLTLVYGASGVGKSSVLMAAVVPGLRAALARDEGLSGLDVPDLNPRASFAVATFAAWRDAPLEGFMSAVATSVREATTAPVAPWFPGTPLRETFAVWLRSVRSLLIVLDQFEEYFLYHPNEDGPGTFAGEFVDVLGDADLRVNFLLSLREDGLGKLDRFQGRVPGLFHNYLRVEHLTVDAARQAIEGPKDEYNRRLPDGSAPAQIDAAVVDEVLAEVRTRAAVTEVPRGPAQEGPVAPDAADRVETPLLQLVMRRLWEAAAADAAVPHLRLSTLREQLGGTEKIVDRHLHDALDTLSDRDRDLAVDILRPLVSPTGGKIAWRAADLGYWAKHPVEDVEPIVRELSAGERRILRPVMPPASQADQSPSYEIFHDILATPILDWCADREEQRRLEAVEAELEQQAREREQADRARRKRRRRRLWRAASVVVVLGSLVAVLAIANRSRVAGSRALAANAMTQLAFDPERSLLLAIRAMDRHDTFEAEQALRVALVSSRVRAVLADGRSAPCPCPGLVTPAAAGSAGTLQSIAIASDGRTIAAAPDGRLRLWHPSSGLTSRPGVDVGSDALVAFTPDARRVLVVGTKRTAIMAADGSGAITLPGSWLDGAVAPDSRHVVTLGRTEAVVWDVSTGRRVARLGEAAPYDSAAFAGAGRLVVENGFWEIVQWRWRSNRTRLLVGEPDRADVYAAVDMVYAARGGLTLSRGPRGRARVVGVRGRPRTLAAGSSAAPVQLARISPDGSRAATTVEGSTVELWRLDRRGRERPERVAELEHDDGIADVAFSADSALVATASSDGTARVWESSTGGLVAVLGGHTAGVRAVAFSSDGRFVATVSEDLKVRLWDLGLEHALRLRRGADVMAVGGSPPRVAVGERGGGLKLWDLRGSMPIAVDTPVVTQHGFRIHLRATAVAVAPDDDSVLAGYGSADGAAGRAALVDSRSGRVRRLIDVRDPVQQVGIERSGRLAAIVTVTRDGTRADVWDLRAAGGPRRLWHLPAPAAEGLSDAQFSADGRLLLATSVVGSARIFDVATHHRLRTLQDASANAPGAEAFYRGTFSPDGMTVAVAASRDVRLWDVRSGAERRFRLHGHTSVLRSVAYDARGRRIVTASADGTTRVWDARDGTMLAVLRRHAGGVNGAGFLPDGSIVSAGDDRTVRSYPCESCAAPDTLLARARAQVTRKLDADELRAFGE